MSIDVKYFVQAVLKFIGWYIFRETYQKERKSRLDKINADYIASIQKEMYKDE